MVAFTDRRVYGLALGSFYHVYLAIEKLLYKCRDTDALTPIVKMLPRIERHEQFAVDLQYFLGPSWKANAMPSQPVQQYIQRLSLVAEQKPHLLIAHSFAMHAALMAGGQLLKKMLIKHVKLEPGKGTSTFDYKEPVQQLRTEYKQIINRLPEVLSTEQAEEVLQEHRRAFEYNIAIVKEFHVGYGRFAFALQKLIPSWVYLAGILAIIAVWTLYYLSGRSRF
ncbi:hypothetical protein WJX77_006558 [Trebouxia sp. C0004]